MIQQAVRRLCTARMALPAVLALLAGGMSASAATSPAPSSAEAWNRFRLAQMGNIG